MAQTAILDAAIGDGSSCLETRRAAHTDRRRAQEIRRAPPAAAEPVVRAAAPAGRGSFAWPCGFQQAAMGCP